eukprot:gene7999-16376_t
MTLFIDIMSHFDCHVIADYFSSSTTRVIIIWNQCARPEVYCLGSTTEEDAELLFDGLVRGVDNMNNVLRGKAY